MLLATREPVSRNLHYPSPGWLRAAQEECKFTPDVVSLFQSEYRLLFAYGEEQPDHPRQEELIGTIPCGWTAYSFERFACYKRRLQHMSHPLAFRDDPHSITGHNSAFKLHVRGTIIPVATSRLLTLDRLRQNGVWFKRERVKAIVWYTVIQPDGEELVRAYIARPFMYVAQHDYWKDHLDAGYDYPVLSSYPHWRVPLDEHYWFTVDEYLDQPAIQDSVDNEALYKQYVQTSGKTKVPRVRQNRQRHK